MNKELLLNFLDIKVKTIRMKPVDSDGRIPYHDNPLNRKLISAEASLRKNAYRNVKLETNEVFFNDADMICDYNLIIVYNKKFCVPLLTARYYCDADVIATVLKGDHCEDLEFNVKENERGNFLIDRMCANTNSSLYRKYRSYINLLFYSRLLAKNSGSDLVLMARKEKGDKLLNKYLSLGLSVTGSVKHKGREHSILQGNMKTCFLKSKISFAAKIFLLIGTLGKKLMQ